MTCYVVMVVRRWTAMAVTLFPTRNLEGGPGVGFLPVYAWNDGDYAGYIPDDDVVRIVAHHLERYLAITR